MNATKLKGEITADRRLVLERLPEDIVPGSVEVILLQPSTPKPAKRPPRRRQAHPAFGIWARRTDINDAASYAAHLRRQLEVRPDGRD
jgi:hypothetical protein